MTWDDDEYRLIAETRGRIGELISLAMIEGDPAARSLWKPYDSIVVAKGEGLAHLDEMQERLERNTEEPERLEWRAAEKAYPGVVFEPGEQILIAQEDGAVEAGDLMAVLRRRLEAEDVRFQEHDARGLEGDPDVTVVAGGAWTAGLLGTIDVRLPIQAYRTQLASLRFADATDLPMVHDLRRGFYARPESEGSMLAGDGTQLRPFDPDAYDEAADPEFITSIAERVVARFRKGGEAQVRSGWAGLCVGTPDRRPLCGAVPGHDGLYVLTGDNGFGLMRSLALGERLADAVRGSGDPALEPGRFGDVTDFQMQEGFGW